MSYVVQSGRASPVGGNPAKPIKRRYSEADTALLLDAAWWDWPFEFVTERADRHVRHARRHRGRGPGPAREEDCLMRIVEVAKGAYGVAFAADGTTWFTVAEGDRVGRIGPGGGEPVYWEVADGSQPTVIAVGADGTAWFTEFKGDRIGRISADGLLSEIELAEGANPYGIAVDRAGAVWFTESSTDHIGRIGPDGELERFAIPHERGFASAIAAAPGGGLWFTLNAAASVGRVDDDGAVMVLPLALEGAAPVGIASGPSGVWFADIMGDRIGHIDADGTITAVALNAGAKPHAVVADGSGGCWFTEWGGNRIGHVNAAGEVSGHDLPVEGSEPHGIAIAPDGTVWAALEIGQLVGFES
jgi:virginiamycin B lyase